MNAAPFYSIIFDTTQDISKTDQMCELYRYCMIEKDENGIPKALVIKETFLGFHEVKDQTALGLSKKIIKSITDKNIPLNKCRGQGYDGANTMKGTYGGVQKLIKDVEPNAVYVHCAAHNLNLVLNDAVREIIDIIKRWNILSSLISNSESETAVTLKTLNPTRWAGRYDAVFALKVRFVEVQKALAKTILFSCKSDERNEAVSLKKKIENFNFVMLLVFHCKILQIIDATSKALQSKDADLSNALKRLKICMEELEKYRHDFENLKLEANSIAEKWSITPEFSKTRQRKVKRHFGELCEDERLQDPESLFKVNIFYRVLDIIINQLKSRFYPMSELISNFSILQPSTLKALNDTEIMKKALEFVKVYKKDISESFAKEIFSFRSTFRDEIEKCSCIKDLANLLLIKNHFMSCSFPEMCTALLLFLTIPVTTASAERSFSKLKLIKNYLRNSMGQHRLSNLAILSIENTMARSLNFDDVIDTFAEQKARRKDFN
ncbi:zinc finger MYM-type protein 1-like [Ctenocephalides felis]|uniref:zinc finger MYM-type protein 1-like n=1 Tax=Ctenocephalides felis TaxID=7515 RepID=UPI000E6E574B|nr:zinc finger MYM-type protein 1-like [Ctenocephalides felis]